MLDDVRREAYEEGRASETERANKWLDRTMQRTGELADALDVLAHIVSQANVNAIVDNTDDAIVRYDMPVGSIHKAIPFLARFSVVVDQYGAIHKGANCPVRQVDVTPDLGTTEPKAKD